MKIVYGVLAALFLLFAGWQFNDPDSLLWILLYGLVAVLNVMAFMGKSYRPVLIGTGVLIIMWMITLLPNFIDWMQGGTPSITGSMKAESPHVELVREFLGLLISGIAVGFLIWKTRQKIVVVNEEEIV